MVLLPIKVLKIFKYDRASSCYTYVTKVTLDLMSVPSQLNPAAAGQSSTAGQAEGSSGNLVATQNLPIFDGGITVYKDVFIVQYEESAEYIRLQNKGNRSLEIVTRKTLWGRQEYRAQGKKGLFAALGRNKGRDGAASATKRPAQVNSLSLPSPNDQADQDGDSDYTPRGEEGKEDGGDGLQFEPGSGGMEMSTDSNKRRAQHKIKEDKNLAEKSKDYLNKKLSRGKGRNQDMLATAVFDEFLQAFVITRDKVSFYMDLNGNFDTKFRPIEWSDKVLRVQVASPFMIGYLADNTIEVRNIFNPSRVS